MLAGCRGSEAARPGGQSAKCLRWGVVRYRTRRRSADKDDLFTARPGTPTGTSRVTGSATRSGAGTGGNLREHGTSRTNCVTHTARGFAGGADLPARQARRSGGLGAAAAVAVLETDDVLPPTGDGCGGLREAAARVATATSATCGHAELSSKINCVLPADRTGTAAAAPCLSCTSCDNAGQDDGWKSISPAQAAGEPTCRPGSAHPLARGGGRPSGTAVAGRLVRSTRGHRAGRRGALAQAPLSAFCSRLDLHSALPAAASAAPARPC